MSDFDFDGSVSFVGGTTGGSVGGVSEREEVVAAGVVLAVEVVAVELVTERGVEDVRGWLDDDETEGG